MLLFSPVCVRCAAAAALLLSHLPGPTGSALAQDDVQLVGRQLERDSGSRESIQDQLVGMLSEVEVPAVDAVTVADAAPDSLLLSLRVSRLEHAGLTAQLLKENGQIETRIDEVALTPVDDPGEPLGARFTLPEHLPEGTEFQTHYVSLRLSRFGRALPGLEWRYPLVKHWSRPIAPENVVIAIKPAPIGKAADLPATLTSNRPLPRPARVLIPHKALDTRYQLKLPDAARAASPTGAAVNAGQVRALPQLQFQLKSNATTGQKTSDKTTAAKTTPRINNAVLGKATTRQLAGNIQLSNLQLSNRQKQILTRTDVARAKLPKATVIGLTGLKPEDRDRGARGPGTETIDLLSVIHADSAIPVDEILGIRRELYLDLNPESGVLYYVPRDYNLRWTPDDGFGFNMLYAAVAEGMPGQVMMALRLDAGIQARDNRLIQDLAEAYRTRIRRDLKVSVVRPLPVTSQHPSVNIADGLGAYFDIAPDDLVATVLSDVLADMEVSWITDEITKENIELVLSHGTGFGGDVTFALESEPPADPPATISVPARVRLSDPDTFGQLSWQRNGDWRNRTPYPLRLKRLHALLIDDGTPIIYSWNLGDAEIPPQARVEWDAERVPAWIDAKAKRTWVEYAVVGGCDPCNRQVMRAITYGASRPAARQDLVVATLSPLADLGAAELNLMLRSRYFDSGGEALTTSGPVIVNSDGSEFSGGPVYLVDRQPGEERPGDPLFEYRIEVVMPDGTVHSPPADRWLSSHRHRLLIGTVQVEQSLGYLPGN
ncbi:MAG: hypothetical protein WD397_13090 [Wenzhouxiangellaceae bacterium]